MPGKLVRVRDLAIELFGEDTSANRKLIRRLCERGVLACVQTGGGGGALVTRSSVERWLSTAPLSSEERQQRRRDQAADAMYLGSTVPRHSHRGAPSNGGP